jgi:hypothetical protein
VKNNIEDIAKRCLIESGDNTDIGLIKGKTGLCLFYFLYSKYSNNAVLEDLAEELLYEVTEGISNETPIWFGDGLAGIGWAVIFLYQHRYIDGDVNIILNCCDRLITQRDVRRIGNTSLEKGLRGIAAYVAARFELGLEHPMLDEQYANELFARCKEAGVNNYDLSMEALCKYMNQVECAAFWKAGICPMIEKQHEEKSFVSDR